MPHHRVRSASLFLAVLALNINGCGEFTKPQVVGSGNQVTDKREVAPFSKIHAGGAIHVEVTVGEQPTLEVITDDNLIPHILTEVNDGVLTIKSVMSYQTNLAVTVKATVRELTGMNLSGASHGKAAGIAGKEFTADASGASKISLGGSVDELHVQCSGASSVNTLDLVAQKLSAKASGASHIEVTAKASLVAEANGASSVRFSGQPPATNVSAHGASSVQAK